MQVVCVNALLNFSLILRYTVVFLTAEDFRAMYQWTITVARSRALVCYLNGALLCVYVYISVIQFRL